MSVKSQGHSLILVKGHSDFKVKCLTLGLYTQVSDSGPQGPLVFERNQIFFAQSLSLHRLCTVYTVPLHNALIIEVFSKTDQCSHLGKAIDTLIIGDSF